MMFVDIVRNVKWYYSKLITLKFEEFELMFDP